MSLIIYIFQTGLKQAIVQHCSSGFFSLLFSEFVSEQSLCACNSEAWSKQ